MLRHEDRDGFRVVALPGEYDLANASDVEAAVIVASEGDTPVVLDLSATDYIDSSVLSVFVRQRRALGERLRFVVPLESSVRRIFEITGLQTALDLSASFDEAIAAWAER